MLHKKQFKGCNAQILFIAAIIKSSLILRYDALPGKATIL